ncbi:MAG: acyl--CoA ligase [Spirochaetes bacterium]|nr:acyl--CoA ligase [Spirochaetota bacterium]
MQKIDDLLLDQKESPFYLEYQSKHYTKKDLLERVNQFCSLLNKQYAQWQNKKIMIDIEDRLLFIIVFFALLKLKAKPILMPIEIKYQQSLEQDQVAISDNKTGSQIINLDNNFNVDFTQVHWDQVASDPSDICFFLFTSGSTGTSKNIPKYHQNLLIELNELSKAFTFQDKDIFYFTPPLYHIYGLLFGLLLPLQANKPVVLDYKFTPGTIGELLLVKEITVFISIPTYYQKFIDLDYLSDLKNIRILVSSSAPLPLEISQKFYHHQLPITEIYGSTETGGIASRNSAVSPYWKPFSYVNIMSSFQDSKNPQSLIIDSPAISIAYQPTEGYNTDDLVEFNEQQQFKLVGRNNRFVKIAGKRLDLDYVKEQYLQYCLKESGIIHSEEELFVGVHQELVFLIQEFQPVKDIARIKRELRKILPGYAIPRFIIEEKIPRNKMSKIDMKKINWIIERKTQ